MFANITPKTRCKDFEILIKQAIYVFVLGDAEILVGSNNIPGGAYPRVNTSTNLLRVIGNQMTILYGGTLFSWWCQRILLPRSVEVCLRTIFLLLRAAKTLKLLRDTGRLLLLRTIEFCYWSCVGRSYDQAQQNLSFGRCYSSYCAFRNFY